MGLQLLAKEAVSRLQTAAPEQSTEAEFVALVRSLESVLGKTRLVRTQRPPGLEAQWEDGNDLYIALPEGQVSGSLFGQTLGAPSYSKFKRKLLVALTTEKQRLADHQAAVERTLFLIRGT